MKDPSEEKFRQISLSNNAFNNRVGNVIGGKVLLKEVGFEEVDGFLVIKNTDMARVAEFVEEINRVLAEMG